MTASTIILSILISGVDVFCTLIFFDTFLKKREWFTNRYINQALFVLLLMFTGFLSIFLFDNLLYRGIAVVFLYSIVVQFFYRDKYFVKLIFSIFIYVLVLGADIFSLFLTEIFTSGSRGLISEDNVYFILIAALSKTCLFFVVIALREMTGHFFGKGNQEKLQYHWFIYLLMSVVSLVSIMTLIELTYQIGKTYIISVFAIFGLLFLNIIVFRLLEQDHQYKINQRENALHKQQIETELSSLKTFIKTFESQRAYLHDYKQQLLTIKQLISDGDIQDARKLISSLSSELDVSMYRFKTNHPIVDAILNQKFIVAESKSIILDVRADDLSEVRIEPKDLVTILGNIIDNAIEATEKVNFKKIVSIKLSNEEGILIFSVINPVNRKIDIDDNLIFETSKEDKITHGQGIKNVANAIKHCNGDYELACDNQKFQFTALIRL